MTPKSMSNYESSNDGENIVLRLNSESKYDGDRAYTHNQSSMIKIKLDDYPEISIIIIYIRLQEEYHT